MADRIYRVVKLLTDDFQEIKEQESILWEGTNIEQLSSQYPPSDIFGADPLGHHEIEDGWIRWWYRFEVQHPSGQWVQCDDPRHRMSEELSPLEEAIDKENRNRFPGDYVDEEKGGLPGAWYLTEMQIGDLCQDCGHSKDDHEGSVGCLNIHCHCQRYVAEIQNFDNDDLDTESTLADIRCNNCHHGSRYHPEGGACTQAMCDCQSFHVDNTIFNM